MTNTAGTDSDVWGYSVQYDLLTGRPIKSARIHITLDDGTKMDINVGGPQAKKCIDAVVGILTGKDAGKWDTGEDE